VVGVILVTHGTMADGLLDAARMIVGEKESLTPVQLHEEDDVEGLMARIETAIEEIDTGDGVLVLVDLPGASPFNASARIAMQSDSVNVVTGVNLPMLAEMLVQREGNSLEALTELSKSAGTGGVKTLEEILNR
jgi:PTS system mannose-specific IIA component